jgi:hypothetical protein
MTPADTGRALLQLVLDQYGPTIDWQADGEVLTIAGADAAAGLLLNLAHELIYGQTLTTRGGLTHGKPRHGH